MNTGAESNPLAQSPTRHGYQGSDSQNTVKTQGAVRSANSRAASSRAASSRPTLLKLTFVIFFKTVLFSSIPFPAEKSV